MVVSSNIDLAAHRLLQHIRCILLDTVVKVEKIVAFQLFAIYKDFFLKNVALL